MYEMTLVQIKIKRQIYSTVFTFWYLEHNTNKHSNLLNTHRVVSWEISGNFLRNFSENVRKNNGRLLFRKNSAEIFRQFVT